MFDGLFCAFDQVAMGAGTEKYAASAGLSREEQDELSAKSHQRAAAAAISARARSPRNDARWGVK